MIHQLTEQKLAGSVVRRCGSWTGERGFFVGSRLEWSGGACEFLGRVNDVGCIWFSSAALNKLGCGPSQLCCIYPRIFPCSLHIFILLCFCWVEGESPFFCSNSNSSSAGTRAQINVGQTGEASTASISIQTMNFAILS